MQSFKNILIYHTGAIGDTVLSTPVGSALRKHYPNAHITQICHRANLDLLALTNNVDNFFACESVPGWLEQRQYVAKLKPDLIVDLSGSTKSRLITQFHKGLLLRYRKQSVSQRPIMHAADNFLATLTPLGLPQPFRLFPTLTLPSQLSETAMAKTRGVSPVVACVPGVGRRRCHRAWSKSNWVGLVNALLNLNKFPVLIGGNDDVELCDEIANAANVLNLAGSLSLCETAAMLKLSQLTISCDTGPAHIAVAVGTPVVGLYGPTFIERSGPYGCLDRCVNVSTRCSCTGLKSCAITGQPGPGYCMDQISVDDVLRKI
jgi:ADP-heptose:LPS heptosyltransferase